MVNPRAAPGPRAKPRSVNAFGSPGPAAARRPVSASGTAESHARAYCGPGRRVSVGRFTSG
jgi:hypothetical protein